jgi:hypothetical protein
MPFFHPITNIIHKYAKAPRQNRRDAFAQSN